MKQYNFSKGQKAQNQQQNQIQKPQTQSSTHRKVKRRFSFTSKNINDYFGENDNTQLDCLQINQTNQLNHNDLTVLLTPGYCEPSPHQNFEKQGRIIVQNPKITKMKLFNDISKNKRQSLIVKYLWEMQSKIQTIISSIKESAQPPIDEQNPQKNIQQKNNNMKLIKKNNFDEGQMIFSQKLQIKDKKKRRLRRGSVRLQIINHNQIDEYGLPSSVQKKQKGLQQFRIQSAPLPSRSNQIKMIRDLNMSVWHTQGLKIGSGVTKFAIKHKDIVLIIHHSLTNHSQLAQIDSKIKQMLVNYKIDTQAELDRQIYQYNSSQRIRINCQKAQDRLQYWSKHIRKYNPKCIIGHIFIIQSTKQQTNPIKVANQSNLLNLAKKNSKNFCFFNFQSSDDQFEKQNQNPNDQQDKITISQIENLQNQYIIILQIKTNKNPSLFEVEEQQRKTQNSKNKERLQKIVDNLLSQYLKNVNISSTNIIIHDKIFDKNSQQKSCLSYSNYKICKQQNINDKSSHQYRNQQLNIKNLEQIHNKISQQHISLSIQNIKQINNKEIVNTDIKNGEDPQSYPFEIKLRPNKQLVVETVSNNRKIIIKEQVKSKKSASFRSFLANLCGGKRTDQEPNNWKVKVLDQNQIKMKQKHND